MFIVQVSVATVVNYDRNTFTVLAKRSVLAVKLKLIFVKKNNPSILDLVILMDLSGKPY
jgi:hypothetical protein